jgi:acyl-CoA synthetase (AMP-forming)/AMP-acid ligase II
VIANEKLRTPQLQHILKNSESACLVTDAAQMKQVSDLTNTAPVIDVGRLKAPIASSPIPPAVIGADLAQIAYTAGTTGPAKGVMISHDNLLSAAAITSHLLAVRDTDVIVSLLPFSFDYGLTQLLTTVAAGATLVMQRSAVAAEITQTIQRERATGVATAASTFRDVTSGTSPFMVQRSGDLRFVTACGARVPEEAVRAFRAAHPAVKLYFTFGLTEAFRSTYLPPEAVDERPTSIGKAMPNVETLVITPSGGSCRNGEIGELVHRGAGVAMGYWRDPSASGRVFRSHPSQFYFSGREEVVVFTGDLVRCDEDGFLYYVGRKDEQIQSQGFRISPEDLEMRISSSNLVSRVVAFPMPAQDGQNIGLAVVPREPSKFRKEQLNEFCQRQLPEHMRPRIIWSVAELPMTPNGRADRRRVRDMFFDSGSH